MLAATLQVAIDGALGGKNIWEENMKAHVVTLTAAIVAGGTGAAYAASATVNITAIDANGVGKQIGTLHLSDTKAGLQITPLLAGLPAADHGFHVHVNPNCGLGNGPNGQPAAGMAAGDHYDPANTGKHRGPLGEGHKGDLPVLTVDESGKATKDVVAPHLTVADVKGHSIMIHVGGDGIPDPASATGWWRRSHCVRRGRVTRSQRTKRLRFALSLSWLHAWTTTEGSLQRARLRGDVVKWAVTINMAFGGSFNSG